MGRPDGRKVKSIPPFDKVIPYIMPQRYDATNMMAVDFPYDILMNYIGRRKQDGVVIPMMACILAAYIRTVAQIPAINRFSISKKIYARKGIWTSFVTLKERDRGGEKPSAEETVVKLCFTGEETIDEVARRVTEAIDENRKAATSNSMDKLLSSIFAVPLIPSFLVSLIKFADRRGWLPKSIIDASPFHTSVFFTNMASIRAYPIYHHLYEFGTTSCFISLGVDINNRGKYQMKVCTDERCCNGATYVHAMHRFLKALRHPEQLEAPPEEVKEDVR
ncbi:MAG: hypothetical protein LBR14_03010 [Clostridiales Family XIII bacterium]|jgi:hypothetical protein|nr:hypothetical protein [Clostridiales Family XIII bacterium]